MVPISISSFSFLFAGSQSLAKCLTEPQYLQQPPFGYKPFSF